MRALVAALPALLLTIGCDPIQTSYLSKDRLPAGSAITLHVVGFDGNGLEHTLAEVLNQSGFDVRSSAAVSLVVQRSNPQDAGDMDSLDTLRRYQTPYVCRVKAFGRGDYVSFFVLQIIHVETGRILLSMRSSDSSYRVTTLAKVLREQLDATLPRG